jgi:hypothetical protein
MKKRTDRRSYARLGALAGLAVGSAMMVTSAAQPAPEPEGAGPSGGSDKVVNIRVVQCTPTPVMGASVYVKDTGSDAADTRTTNSDGVVTITFAKAPKDQVLVQVTAPGHQTYGRLYKLSETSSQIKVTLD